MKQKLLKKTHFILIKGMLIQFAAATAANGTNLPTNAGAFYGLN